MAASVRGLKGRPRCAAAVNEDQTHTYLLAESYVLRSEQTHRFNKTQREGKREGTGKQQGALIVLSPRSSMTTEEKRNAQPNNL